MAPREIRCRVTGFWKIAAPLGVLTALSIALDPQQWIQMTPIEYGALATCVLALFGFPFLLRKSYALYLAPTGLTIQYLMGRRRTVPWHAIERVQVAYRNIGDVLRPPVVLLTVRREGVSMARRALRRVAGGDISIMAVFELPAEEIVVILEEWRQRYAPLAGAEPLETLKDRNYHP